MCVIRLTKEQIADVQRQLDEWKRDYPSELRALRAHVEEAKNDPDYDVVLSYPYYSDIPDSTCHFSPEYSVESAPEPETKSPDQTQSPRDRD